MTTSTNTPAVPQIDVIGVSDIAEIKGVAANTVASWRTRDNGKIPAADQVVSGVPVWRRSLFTDPDGQHEPLPTLVGPAEVARMFGVDVETVWQWRHRATVMWKNVTLPEPVARMGKTGKTPIWLPEQWQPFAEQTGRPIDLTAAASG